MAKKNTGRTIAKPRKGQSAEEIETTLAAPLRQEQLDGLPRVRNARLDKLAEAVGDCRDQINQNTLDEKSYRAAALKEMQAKDISFWSHSGVDFIRVPGEDKLKVKTHKGDSSETGGGDESGEE